MMHRALLLAFLVSSRALAYDALTRATELLYWNPAKAQNGYTFFGVGGTTYLIDMEGRVVKTWPIGNNPRDAPATSISRQSGTTSRADR